MKATFLRALLLLGTWLLVSAPVEALSVYGRGNYGQCAYQQDCPPPANPDGTPATPPTVVTTPSKLEVAVNLTEGQSIPLAGYTILITPLNGEGRSYTVATITIDGNVVFEGPPRTDGTGEFFWKPTKIGEHTIVVTIVDDTDQTTTLIFHVTVVEAIPSVTPSQGESQPAEELTGLGAFFGSVDKNLRQFFRSLPPEVVRGVSYLLLLLALLIIAMLLFQLRREIAHHNRLIALARQRERVAEDRLSFIRLVSHFLRTPLTILGGGIDMLKPTNQILAEKMRVFAENIRLNTEKLLDDLQTVTTPAPAVLSPPGWHRLTLWLPLIAIGLLLFILDALRIRYQVEDNAWGDSIIQALVFIAIIVGTWLLSRHLQLRRRERAEAEATTMYQNQLASARDRLVHDALQTIKSDVKSLSTAPLPEVEATRFIRQGLTDLNALITKLAMAEHAQESLRQGIPQPTLIASLLPSTPPEHPLNIRGGDQPYQIVRPDLLTYILHSLINNAVAYSHDQAPVEVAASSHMIAITSHGDYLTEEALSMLFKPFSRVEGALDFTHAGMGFELYLDRLIMRSLGGDIEFTSAQDGRNTVTILLPTPTMTEQGSSPATEPAGPVTTSLVARAN